MIITQMTTNQLDTNYFYDIPMDLQSMILKKSIPTPPSMPDSNKQKTYDFETDKLNYIDSLVEYLPTSIVLKKRYNNLCKEWNVKSDKIVWADKKYKYSEIKKFNDKLDSYIEDHSNKELQNEMKKMICKKMRPTQTYYDRFGKRF